MVVETFRLGDRRAFQQVDAADLDHAVASEIGGVSGSGFGSVHGCCDDQFAAGCRVVEPRLALWRRAFVGKNGSRRLLRWPFGVPVNLDPLLYRLKCRRIGRPSQSVTSLCARSRRR